MNSRKSTSCFFSLFAINFNEGGVLNLLYFQKGVWVETRRNEERRQCPTDTPKQKNLVSFHGKQAHQKRNPCEAVQKRFVTYF